MYDLYNQTELKVPTHKTLPEGAPLISWSAQLSVQLENGTGTGTRGEERQKSREGGREEQQAQLCATINIHYAIMLP
jgi:hypothetical protein